MEKDKKSTTVAGVLMSEQPDHSNIALISAIIKDGVKNFKELAKKFAACKKLSYEEAQELIAKMNEEGKVGYYHTKYSVFYESPLYYFTKWNPNEKTFPESPAYKSDKYFKPLFRD